MLVEKCLYFNNHQTTCSLMIDDLVPVAISEDGTIGPHNDWGYMIDKEGSLHNYFDRYFLQKYPEIRGTIFLPIDSHNHLPLNVGYVIKNRGFDDSFLSFLNRISEHFEFAFHGIKHAWEDESGRIVHEFRNIEANQLEEKHQALKVFEDSTGIRFNGGKFPGYGYNGNALDFLKHGNFNWWALDAVMLNKVSKKNNPVWNEDLKIVLVPTNVTGDIFKNYYWRNSARRTLVNILKYPTISHPVDYLRYLYENGIPITIQEHFQNQTTKGTRQPINIYDDIWSLDQIFGLLRGLDIWYTTCGEIANYYFNYINTSIKKTGNDSFDIISNKPFKSINITIRTPSARLHFLDENIFIQGIRKKDWWVFNNLKSGSYRAL